MRRLLVALPLALAIGAGVAGVSGAFSSSGGSTSSHAAAATSTMATMPMPTATTSASATAPASVELHHAVVQVKIENFAFQPARIVVSPGTKVTWTNEDSDPHTVTTDRPGFSSQALDTGSRFAEVVTHAGTITYHCTIHPFMHGTVVVQ